MSTTVSCERHWRHAPTRFVESGTGQFVYRSIGYEFSEAPSFSSTGFGERSMTGIPCCWTGSQRIVESSRSTTRESAAQAALCPRPCKAWPRLQSRSSGASDSSR